MEIKKDVGHLSSVYGRVGRVLCEGDKLTSVNLVGILKGMDKSAVRSAWTLRKPLF